jgi:beta-lactamase class A
VIRALLVLFQSIATGSAVNAGSDAAMVDILEHQKFNDAIPAGVPAGTAVAHKTGNITMIHHDAGIVYAPRPYVLVILVRGIADRR